MDAFHSDSPCRRSTSWIVDDEDEEEDEEVGKGGEEGKAALCDQRLIARRAEVRMAREGYYCCLCS